MGTAALSLVAAVAAVVDWDAPGSIYLLIGYALYLLGVIGLTGGYHVARNHVGVGAGVAAAAMFTVALRVS